MFGRDVRGRRLVRLLACALCAAPLVLSADFSRESGAYVFRNYSQNEYGATPPCLNLALDKRGIAWFACTDAVLEFDGVTWRKIALPGSLVRSVDIDEQGTVYVGRTGDFGVVKPSAEGSPAYVSLLDRVPKEDRQFAAVWRVLPARDGVYFSSYNRLFRLNPSGTVSVWRPKSRFGRAFSIDGFVFVKTSEQGLLQMRADQLAPVLGGDIMAKEQVEDASPFADGALIATANRLYRMTADGIRPFATTADAYLAKNPIYCLSVLPAGDIAVGTRSGGLVMIAPSGELERAVTKTEGLPDDYIMSISPDGQGGVWLTTVSGIGRFNPGLTRFDSGTGLEGDVRDSARHNDTLYAGTTKGLFRLTPSPGALPRFERVPGIPNAETVWAMLSLDRDLLAATSRGIYAVSGNNAGLVVQTRQEVVDLSASLRNPGTVYAAGTGALYRLRKEGGKWRAEEFPAQGKSFRTILEDNDGKVWATTQDSILRFDFAQTPVKSETFGASQGVPPGWINARRLGDHVAFATSQGLRRFSEQGRRLAPDITLGNEFADGSRDVVNLFDSPSGDVWVTGENDHGKKYHGILVKQAGAYRWHPAPLVQSGIDEVWWMSFDADGTAWATGADGILFRWQPSLAGDPDRGFSVLTRRVQGTGNGAVVYGGDGPLGNIRLPWQSNTLRFEFAAPFYESPAAVEYRFQLAGADRDWSPWSHEHLKDYNNLYEGNYTFRVQARSPHGAAAEQDVFAFSVLPPWHRTWLAYAVYAVLAGFGVWGIVGLRTRQLEADKRRLEHTVEERTVEIRQQRDEIHAQERKSHSLLLNILPAQVADELKATGAVKPVGFDDVTVCFTDFVGFTLSSEKMPPDGLVNALNEYFTAFDEIVTRYGLEKLKTIGDSYMFVSGLPVRKASHAVDAVLAALEMADVVKRLADRPGGTGWDIRIGLHSGPVVAGVVGIRKFAFDIWGNTVNFAARMESSGVRGRVNMSERTCRLTRELIVCESRGNVRIKEGRELAMFLAAGPAEDFDARYEAEFGTPPAVVPATANRTDTVTASSPS